MDRLVAAARAAGVRDERVLDAIATVPRADFVPAAYGRYAAADAPIPIPHDQVTTQPSLVARMVEALALTGDERRGDLDRVRVITGAHFVRLHGRYGFP